MKNKARILVTNDLTNLINVDKIIYMKRGSIIFTGTFEEYKKYFSLENLTWDFIKKGKIIMMNQVIVIVLWMKKRKKNKLL